MIRVALFLACLRLHSDMWPTFDYGSDVRLASERAKRASSNASVASTQSDVTASKYFEAILTRQSEKAVVKFAIFFRIKFSMSDNL